MHLHGNDGIVAASVQESAVCLLAGAVTISRLRNPSAPLTYVCPFHCATVCAVRRITKGNMDRVRLVASVNTRRKGLHQDLEERSYLGAVACQVHFSL